MNDTHFHRRYLPHIYIPNSVYFITYRLKDTIPINILNELRKRKEFNKDFQNRAEKYSSYERFFVEYDKLLDNNYKIQHLKNPRIAKVVTESLHYYNKTEYELVCYTIMPNHVHLVFSLLESPAVAQAFQSEKEPPYNFNFNNRHQKVISNKKPFPSNYKRERISKIMKSIKGYSAREANKALERKGAFWQSESYDHIIRDEDELERIVKYVIYNPVKARLTENWEEWEHTYLQW